MSFDETGKPLYGRLATDRPFTFKSQVTYDLPWGTGLGMLFYAATGQPLSSQATMGGVPVFYKGRGNLGRLPMSMQTDINLQHGIRLPGNTRAELELNVLNLFDQDIANQISNVPYRMRSRPRRDGLLQRRRRRRHRGGDAEHPQGSTVPSVLRVPGRAHHALHGEVQLLARGTRGTDYRRRGLAPGAVFVCVPSVFRVLRGSCVVAYNEHHAEFVRGRAGARDRRGHAGSSA